MTPFQSSILEIRRRIARTIRANNPFTMGFPPSICSLPTEVRGEHLLYVHCTTASSIVFHFFLTSETVGSTLCFLHRSGRLWR